LFQASVDISNHSGLWCEQYKKQAVPQTVLVSWDKMRNCSVLTYKSGLEGGMGGVVHPFWHHKETLTFKGQEA